MFFYYNTSWDINDCQNIAIFELIYLNDTYSSNLSLPEVLPADDRVGAILRPFLGPTSS